MSEVHGTALRIAARLRAARIAKGLSIGDACTEAGVPETTLRRVEKGQCELRVQHAHRLCELYGVTMQSLVDPDA